MISQLVLWWSRTRYWTDPMSECVIVAELLTLKPCRFPLLSKSLIWFLDEVGDVKKPKWARSRVRPHPFPAGVLAKCHSRCSTRWPCCLWFTNCFTNISSLCEVWYVLHPQQLNRATQPPSQTCLCLQLFRKFSQRKKTFSFSNVLFLSQHFLWFICAKQHSGTRYCTVSKWELLPF